MQDARQYNPDEIIKLLSTMQVHAISRAPASTADEHAVRAIRFHSGGRRFAIAGLILTAGVFHISARGLGRWKACML